MQCYIDVLLIVEVKTNGDFHNYIQNNKRITEV